VFWASGIALILGLTLIYVPVHRHPAVLLLLALALLAVGSIAPEPTLLFAQAATLGLTLTLLAGFLERKVMGKHRQRGLPKEPSHPRVELGSTHTLPRSPWGNGQASTETMPAAPPPSGNADS
jgi:hypothetical protein